MISLYTSKLQLNGNLKELESFSESNEYVHANMCIFVCLGMFSERSSFSYRCL